MVTLSRALTIGVIALAIIAVSILAYTQFNIITNSYSSKIRVTFVRSPETYDYSCGESDYQLYFVVDNIGSKSVADLSLSITNPLCSGGVPPNLPKILGASSTLSFEAQSSNQNGTLTITGNNTLVEVNF
jgi:hypothetical protein